MRFLIMILIFWSMLITGSAQAENPHPMHSITNDENSAETTPLHPATDTACTCVKGDQKSTNYGDVCVLGDVSVHELHAEKREKKKGPLLSFENLGNLLVLIFLQAVLGFDNLLYISLESQRAPKEDQEKVRKYGILIAIALRVILLFIMITLLEKLTTPFFDIGLEGYLEGSFTFSSIVFIAGGVFIMYTAVKEISHMLVVDDLHVGVDVKEQKSSKAVIAMIVLMNLVFSFDSILSALAITDVFIVLALAIIASGLGMLVLADQVAKFLERNRKYEVLGMFILLIVGVVLLGEGGHVAHLKVLDNTVEPMSKSTFYFSLVVLVAVDIIQAGYQKKLNAERYD